MALNCLDLGLNGDNKVGKKTPRPWLVVDQCSFSTVYLHIAYIIHSNGTQDLKCYWNADGLFCKR